MLNFGRTFRSPDLTDPDWERLRLLLLKRSLMLILPVLSLYFIIRAALASPILPSLMGICFCVLLLALVQWQPEARRWGLWVTALATQCILWLGTWAWQGSVPAPTVFVAALFGVLGLMLDGPGLGALLLALGLGLDGAVFLSLASGDLGGRIAVGVLGGLSIGLYMSALGWYWSLRRGRAELDQASRGLLLQRDERQVLTLALFHELRLAQRGLQAALGYEGKVPWDAALAESKRVQQRADEIRALRDSFSGDLQLQTQARDFGRGVMLVVLWSSLALAAVGSAVDLLSRGGKGVNGPIAVLVLGALLLAMRGRRQVPRWMALAVCLLGPAIMVADAAKHWGETLPVTLSFWSLSILNAGLLLGLPWALGFAAAGVLLLLAASYGQLVAGHFTGQCASVLALSWALVSIVCLQAMLWQGAVIRLLDNGRQQLASGLNLRRRLLGTLFHDIANPLMVLIRLAEDGRAGLEGPGDAARARRLCRRLGELLEGAQAWLTSEDDAETQKLDAVDLEPLLAGLADLFNDALAAKRLSLHIEAEPGLRAVAQPAVLRDSVLANLISNAGKFSRPGSSLELLARRDGPWALIRLSDHGPGWPQGLRERLERGLDQPSTPGTEGERGQGLGLALAREHVLRMGGRFELLDREGGGALVEVRLRSGA